MVKKLLIKHRRVIEKIYTVLKEGDFYLAGGTAVYYYLLHRNSIDLDFFTNKNVDLRNFVNYFRTNELKLISQDTMHAIVNRVKVSLFFYPYPLLKPLINLELIKIASLEDILCMKISAIISRGSRKDFIDTFFIMKDLKISASKVIEMFKKKYGNYEEIVIKKSLTFFEDADNEPEIPTLKKVKWDEIKNFFIKNFAKL